MRKSNSLPPAGHYNSNYGNFQTELYAPIRHEAFGEDIGQNSWLTSDEQDRFLEWLDLSPGNTLLDVACGAEARRCGSPLLPTVLLSALTFTNRRLRRRIRFQLSAAWPSGPNFDA
jgi:hypothetical protein